MPAAFEVLSGDGAARRGRLTTARGTIETPAFMPVGTLGTVKGVPPRQLAGLGAEVMLANLYHLALRPGVDLIERLGGLHRLTGWHGPILTDSGGYQVFSLAELVTVSDRGVDFQSHVDGARLSFTPEVVIDLQSRLGVDVAMVLDECPPWPVDRDRAARSWQRTLGWARRSLTARSAARERGWEGMVFGIAQGSAYEDLRRQAAGELAELGFDGHAIGGVSVGEPDERRRSVVEWTAPALPADRPRYLMGVGSPADLAHAVGCGVDLFDCVLPARNARHGYYFTRGGVIKIKNARFRDDPRPIDPDCRCPACTQVSRAFLHHLVRAGELTGKVLGTLHNLAYFLDFMADLRQAIESGCFEQRVRDLLAAAEAS